MLTRERLIYQRLKQALARLAVVEAHAVDETEDTPCGAIVPGLMLVDEGRLVIALGREAHLALSSVRKRTVVAYDLVTAIGGDAEGEIARLVWSSVNTTKLVALGLVAWQSAQLLPVGERRRFHVPPLQVQPADEAAPSVLVINHDARDTDARAVTRTLIEAGITARLTGVAAETPDVPPDAAWSDDAWIHVHVGAHTLDADEIRLVDSWHSDRVALELALPRHPPSPGEPAALAITDQANGFVCGTPAEVAALCRDLIDDPILRHRLIGFGRSSVALPLKDWDVLAADLLA